MANRKRGGNRWEPTPRKHTTRDSCLRVEENRIVPPIELPKITGDAQFRLLDGASNIMGNKNDSLSDSGVFSALRHSGGKWVVSVVASSKQATDNTDVLHLEFGNNQPHNTLPPSIACYGWRRTA